MPARCFPVLDKINYAILECELIELVSGPGVSVSKSDSVVLRNGSKGKSIKISVYRWDEGSAHHFDLA